MSITSVESGVHAFRRGELVIIFDDVKTQMASLAGKAESVSPQKVNTMIKLGKGLVCVCITEDHAEKLKLPFMLEKNYAEMKPFAVSVDYITTTTGISAFERADTIRAFTDENVQLEHFRTPGHLFPLVSKNKGLLQRVDIAEAAVDLAIMSSSRPIAYICEILNASGDIATRIEVEYIAETHDICVLNVSDMLEYKKNEMLCSFSAVVLKGNEFGQKIGYSILNLQVDLNRIDLVKGVYGVNIVVNHVKYIGVMNIGVRCEVHILDFNQIIYNQFVQVEVMFFVREQISFSALDELILQIGKDVEFVEKRCGLQKVKN
jgi:3,4-dihydroxy-2-butanone 4-phosphate synthase